MQKPNPIWFTEQSDDFMQKVRILLVPVMLFSSSMIMAIAWLGHLKLKQLPFFWATLFCWLLVLPEYCVNILAIRMGYRVYTGAQMAAFRLCSGVVCVALVSRFLLDEHLGLRKLLGFGLMMIAMVLINKKSSPTI